MDIGEIEKTYTIEPLREPIPGKEPTPAPEEPARKAPAIEPEREKVPA